MEALQEALMSRNILAWGIVILLVVLVLRLLKSVTKGFMILVGIFILIFMIQKFFPGVAAPMLDFVQGGWLEGNSD
jgi:hypothetical protein